MDDQQLDIFEACYVDIPIRDQRDTMERPFFSLAKSPRKQPIEYNVNGTVVKVSPVDEYGIATIWDADILIWAATQITETLSDNSNCLKSLNSVRLQIQLLRCRLRGTRISSGRAQDRKAGKSEV